MFEGKRERERERERERKGTGQWGTVDTGRTAHRESLSPLITLSLIVEK